MSKKMIVVRDPLEPELADVVKSVNLSIIDYYRFAKRSLTAFVTYVEKNADAAFEAKVMEEYLVQVNGMRNVFFDTVDTKLNHALHYGKFSKKRAIMNALIRKHNLPGSYVGRKEQRDMIDAYFEAFRDDEAQLELSSTMVLRTLEVPYNLQNYHCFKMANGYVDAKKTNPDLTISDYLDQNEWKKIEEAFVKEVLRVIYAEHIRKNDIHIYGFDIPGYLLVKTYMRDKRRFEFKGVWNEDRILAVREPAV